MVSVWPNSSKTVEIRRQQLLEMGRENAGSDAQWPRSFVLRNEGEIVAHAAVMPRKIGTHEGEILIAALSRVCTNPEKRGRGWGEQVVRAALALVDAGVFRFSLFQTTPEVRPFYEKLGAVAIGNRIVNSLSTDDHQESPFWDPVIMRYPDTGLWPEGEIDLRGPGY